MLGWLVGIGLAAHLRLGVLYWLHAASVPEPQAALLTGILLGDDSGLPDTTRDAFRETDMTHIIAICGQVNLM